MITTLDCGSQAEGVIGPAIVFIMTAYYLSMIARKTPFG